MRRDSSAGSTFTRLTPREGGAEDDTGVPLSHYARPALTAVAGGEEKGERWKLRLHSTLFFLNTNGHGRPESVVIRHTGESVFTHEA